MKLSRDGILWVPSSDDYFTMGFEKLITRKVLAQLETDGTGTFLDIGGNVGLWTLRLHELFAKCYIVEPVAEHVECINKNFEVHGVKNATILQTAASDSLGEGEIRLTDFNSGRASLNFKIKSGEHETVPLAPLDSLIKDKDIKFIKMDVEGHEVQALGGMTQILKNNNPVIFIEVLKKEKKKAVNGITMLESIGYKVINQYGDNFLMTRDI